LTNSFNADGPSNTTVNPTFEIGGKSSFVDPSQCPDDPNMPALQDVIYSDDEEDVGAETDFSNLETSITISPIPTTRVHKDHHVTQIIGDLSSAPQIRSMRAVFGHVLGASKVEIPETNLDNLHSTVEEDGTLEIMDPQDLLGSFLSSDNDLFILELLTGTLILDSLGFCE
nr:hypothetical protein [Tanacetum cinerariifolium]